ncbi:hypothetical protein GCM10027586_00480 [Kineococcus gypseus]|uniref:hypothetical protein n=1 Tax=Kineococcus gypseus TaxID=1637102 RepID=UPI003D7CC308
MAHTTKPAPLAAQESLTVNWRLAHRSVDGEESQYVVIDAPSSAEAITQLREQMPADHRILYIDVCV